MTDELPRATVVRGDAGSAAGDAPGAGARPIALRTEGLCKSWGGIFANDNVSLSLPVGARHALIGPNGAGKTTFVNLLTGLYPPSAGRVLLGATDVTRLAMHERVRRGMVRTFQINTLFPGLTVLESVVTGDLRAHPHRPHVAAHRVAARRTDRRGPRPARPARPWHGRPHRHPEPALRQAAPRRDRPRPGARAQGAPARRGPRPASPLATAPRCSRSSPRCPRTSTILFIEHDMELVFRFAQRIAVLVDGKLLTEGTPAEIAADARVRDVYLGEAGAPAGALA